MRTNVPNKISINIIITIAILFLDINIVKFNFQF